MVKRKAGKYYLTVNVQRIFCCLTLIGVLKGWVKQQWAKFAHYMDVLRAVQGLWKSIAGLSNEVGVKEQCQ